MAASAVFKRTDAGAQEVRQRALNLSRAERLILILSDGKADLNTVRAKLPAVSRTVFNQALQRLVDDKLLASDGAAEAAPGKAAVGLNPESRLLEEAASYVKVVEPLAAAARLQDDFAATQMKRPEGAGRPPVGSKQGQREEGLRGARATAGRRFSPGLLAGLLLILGVVGVAVGVYPVYQELQPEPLSRRLSQASGMPVSVSDSEFHVFPRPAVVLKDLKFGTALSIPELFVRVELMSDAEDLRAGASMGSVSLTVPALALTAAQGLEVLSLVERLSAALSERVKVIKINELHLIDVGDDRARYVATAHRSAEVFDILDLYSSANGDRLGIKLKLERSPDQVSGVSFRLDAGPWRPLVGPALRWTQVSAQGRLDKNLVLVDSFQLTGFGGSVGGAAVAAHDVEWVVAADVRATQIRLLALLEAAGAASAERRPPLVGFGNAAIRVEGRGPTLAAARAASRAQGTVELVQAELQGVNLGLAAVQGAAAGTQTKGGGVTRFRELSADVEISDGNIILSNILGRAGALTVLGRMDVGPDWGLDGRLRVELGGARVQAPLGLRVGGSVIEPELTN